MQHELITHIDLLSDKGGLNEKGWARQLVVTYNRERIAASWLHIKEWGYYCVLAPDYSVAMTISDIGYGFGDTSAASENAIVWDGRVHKSTTSSSRFRRTPSSSRRSS